VRRPERSHRDDAYDAANENGEDRTWRIRESEGESATAFTLDNDAHRTVACCGTGQQLTDGLSGPVARCIFAPGSPRARRSTTRTHYIVLAWFSSPDVRDPQLGLLRRSRGRWRGTLALPDAPPVPLIVAGGRRAPDADALVVARDIPARFASWRPAIAAALFEHYAPYADALAAGELDSGARAPPKLSSPDDVWPHVQLLYAAATRLGGALITELGYRVAWDEEHTLGARFAGERLLELCGSVDPGMP
jgi:hypothetical protein